MTEYDYAAIARDAGLPRVGARPPLREYLTEMWHRRHFAATLSRFRIESSLAQNRLGLAWVVLNPLLQAGLYGLIFGVIMPSSSRPEGFLPFLVTGFFIFTFFSQSFGQGAKSITGNASLVRSLSFPRMLLPISAVLQQLYQLVPMLGVLLVILLGFGEFPRWSWLLAIPVLILMTMFNLGVAFIAARLTVHIRDVTQIIPLITRVLFYLTGIFYSLELVLAGKNPALLTIAHINPVYSYVALVRNALLGPAVDKDGNVVPYPDILWATAGISAVVFLVVGFIFFWKAEERYGHE